MVIVIAAALELVKLFTRDVLGTVPALLVTVTALAVLTICEKV